MSEPATPFPGGAVNRRRSNRGTLGESAGRKVERPAPLRQAVYEALIEMIVNRTLQPGQHLVEIELAEYLGVSRQPVREALQRLQTEGWVDLRPAQGAFVHTPTEEEADQLLSVRSVLETHSARLAAEHASPSDVDMLRDLQREGVEALHQLDVGRMVKADDNLHACITVLSRNKVLAELIGMVDRRVRWYYTPIAQPRGEDAWAEHEELINAIAAGDAEEASRIMTVHTERTRLAYHQERQAQASS